jgi:hypothetical protein
MEYSSLPEIANAVWQIGKRQIANPTLSSKIKNIGSLIYTLENRPEDLCEEAKKLEEIVLEDLGDSEAGKALEHIVKAMYSFAVKTEVQNKPDPKDFMKQQQQMRLYDPRAVAMQNALSAMETVKQAYLAEGNTDLAEDWKNSIEILKPYANAWTLPDVHEPEGSVVDEFVDSLETLLTIWEKEIQQASASENGKVGAFTSCIYDVQDALESFRSAKDDVR